MIVENTVNNKLVGLRLLGKFSELAEDLFRTSDDRSSKTRVYEGLFFRRPDQFHVINRRQYFARPSADEVQERLVLRRRKAFGFAIVICRKNVEGDHGVRLIQDG